MMTCASSAQPMISSESENGAENDDAAVTFVFVTSDPEFRLRNRNGLRKRDCGTEGREQGVIAQAVDAKAVLRSRKKCLNRRSKSRCQNRLDHKRGASAFSRAGHLHAPEGATACRAVPEIC